MNEDDRLPFLLGAAALTIAILVAIGFGRSQFGADYHGRMAAKREQTTTFRWTLPTQNLERTGVIPAKRAGLTQKRRRRA